MIYFIILLMGEFMASLSIVFIKISTVHPLLLAAYRLLLAGLFLLPVFIYKYKKTSTAIRTRLIIHSIIPGLLLAMHFITWIPGARLIPAVNASLIVNMTPMLSPFILYMMLREQINRLELIGSLIALVGLLIIVFFDFRFNNEYILGDLLCLVSMIFFAVYNVSARKNLAPIRHKDASIYLYIVPLYIVAGISSLAISAPFASILTLRLDRLNWIALSGLVLISTIGGHTIINYSMKHLRGQVVALTHLSQFIFAGFWGLIFFSELPNSYFYISSIIVITGLIIALQSMGKTKKNYH